MPAPATKPKNEEPAEQSAGSFLGSRSSEAEAAGPRARTKPPAPFGPIWPIHCEFSGYSAHWRTAITGWGVNSGAGLGAMLEMLLRCEADVAAALLALGRLRQAGRRDYLANQGDVLGTMWLVLEGRIEIDSCSSGGRSSRLSTCGPGDWVGSYARPAVHLADIVALEPSTLLAFNAGDLPRLAASHPQLGGTLALSFARQLESIIARLDARSTLSSKGQIYAELLRRAGADHEIAPSPIVAELAHTAQTTRETASRAIMEIERRGIISRTATKLTINSPRLLSDLIV